MSQRVIVVGGGVIGCSVAYELAKAGANVALIERDGIGSHASGRNPGNLNPILGAEPALVPLALESLRLHRALVPELAALGCAPYRFEPVKRVLLAFDGRDRTELDDTARVFAAHPEFGAKRLTSPQLRSLEPRLSDTAVEGLLIEGNESVDSLALTRALAQGAQKAGAARLPSRLSGIRHERKRSVRGVYTESGELACDSLVLATGPWVSETRSWFGIELPVEPVKGEMLRLSLPGANVTHDFTHGIISIYRRGDDEVWVGVTRERCGFDERPTDDGKRRLIEGAARIMPAVREATLIEHLAALRPATPTGLPVIGRAPGWDNVFVANGGGIKGMLLSAGIGVAIRDLVMAGDTSMPVAAFFPRSAQ
jgi:glycine oxidase